ncbi:MAG TPA: transposase [Cyanobacteria bacterium UBA8543]|nr:transposase [Cyanobacteria bacterium UBA8543]
MLLTLTNRLKPTQTESDILRAACHLSKNLFNVGLYTVRQYFFQERKYLRYEGSYHLCKTNENYQLLATDIGQQTLKIVDRAMNGFFKMKELKNSGQYNARVRLPGYLPKDGFFPLIIPIRHRDWAKLSDKGWVYSVPMARAFKRHIGTVSFPIPERVRDKQVKEIRILPKYGAKFFDVAYVYEQEDETQVVGTEVIGIDLGVGNLATCVTTTGKAFVIDGKPLKARNQWYNKRNARLQSIKDIQGIEKLTLQQANLLDKRNHQIKDYLNKAVRRIVDFCLSEGVGKVVVGYNPGIKQDANMGTRNNQNFVQIPYYILRCKLQSLCERVGINYAEQEESYTSKASAPDGDDIPSYNSDNRQTYSFSGKRISRGLYRTKTGQLINADANGSLNILRKHLNLSKADDYLLIGRCSGCVAQPLRLNLEKPLLYPKG